MTRLLIIFTTVIAVFSVPTMAQFIGTSSKNVLEVRQITNGYADCVVKKKPEKARQAILSNATNAVISKKYRRLIIGGCLVKANDGDGGQMRFGGDHFRYAIAGALVRMDLKDHVPRSFNGTPLLSHHEKINPKPEMMARTDRKGRRYQSEIATSRSSRFLSIYGECVVRSDPENSFALAMSEIGTPQETDALAKLQSSFGPCLDNEGSYRFTRQILRGVVNINYYRLAIAARSQRSPVVEVAETETKN